MRKLETHKSFEQEIEVRKDDIDLLGHVNNTVYLRWVQDIAIAHWNTVATKEERENILWVVVRHEIDYKRPTFYEDNIIVKTWVGKANRRTFGRHTEIIRKKDKKILAKAVTLWSPVSFETKRTILPDENVYRRFSTNYLND